MPDKRSTIILTNSRGLEQNTDPVVLLLAIDREDIESGNIGHSLEKLMIITDSRENALLYRESLVIQVCGYDSDPRELAEILEVRAFFEKLVQEWPHWLWYLARGMGCITLLMSLLTTVQIHRKPGSFGIEFTDRSQLHKRLLDLFARGNTMFHTFDISKKDAKESSETAVSDILDSSHI